MRLKHHAACDERSVLQITHVDPFNRFDNSRIWATNGQCHNCCIIWRKCLMTLDCNSKLAWFKENSSWQKYNLLVG